MPRIHCNLKRFVIDIPLLIDPIDGRYLSDPTAIFTWVGRRRIFVTLRSLQPRNSFEPSVFLFTLAPLLAP